MKHWLLIGAVALLGLAACSETRVTLSPPDIRGGPVRVKDASGDRLYFMTAQWEKRLLFSGTAKSATPRKTSSWLCIDLWALDVQSAQPIFRRRLKRAKVNDDSVAMGVDRGLLWARLPELVGVRLTDGAVIADSAKIEARNPALVGHMPKPPGLGVFLTEQMQPLKFIPDAGLVVLLTDARRVQIDAQTLVATPYVPARDRERLPASGGRVAMANLSQGMDWRALVRGLYIARSDGMQDWLGLLGETELAELKTRRNVNDSMDFSEPRRHRLYRAQLRPFEDFFGRRMRMETPEPLAESPEFLMGALLTQGNSTWDTQPALWRRDPDSVFVLSRDRLGEDGRLQLARIAGPAGRVVWSTALPLSAMSSWLPGERHALMLGPDPSAESSPMAQQNENRPMQVVSIDLENGALKTFNLDLHRDWPVDAATETP